MAEVSAAKVKELRERTGAGMMDCKKALAEVAGELEAAVDWLRKKGLAAAQKKAGRVAAEGLVAAATDGRRGAIVEINSETDFVARNDRFQAYVRKVATIALGAGGNTEKLKKLPFESAKTVSDAANDLIAAIGENVQVRRTAALEVGEGVVVSYIHNSLAPGMGKIATLVALKSAGDAGRLAALGRQLAMHVAAARPEAVDVGGLDAAAVERERAVLSDQARASGKAEEIIQKMVEGRLRKYYEEVVLLQQVFVVDGATKIGKVVEQAAKEMGAPVTITGFARFALGEGIEKVEKDFAAEVAAQIKG
ncbi:MAG: elongation factor Ts [Alphaproteobacteria bacterium]|nr:elongation factor Ts [Alphaproteobacteria bacterium]